MIKVNRAKNFEGLMNILKENVASTQEAVNLLSRYKDTESVITRERLLTSNREVTNLARDLATGLVDLEELHFDRKQHELIFGEIDLFAPTVENKEVKSIPAVETDTSFICSRSESFDYGSVPGDFSDDEETPTITLEF